jgi:hypothetical protein
MASSLQIDRRLSPSAILSQMMSARAGVNFVGLPVMVPCLLIGWMDGDEDGLRHLGGATLDPDLVQRDVLAVAH